MYNIHQIWRALDVCMFEVGALCSSVADQQRTFLHNLKRVQRERLMDVHVCRETLDRRRCNFITIMGFQKKKNTSVYWAITDWEKVLNQRASLNSSSDIDGPCYSSTDINLWFKKQGSGSKKEYPLLSHNFSPGTFLFYCQYLHVWEKRQPPPVYSGLWEQIENNTCHFVY